MLGSSVAYRIDDRPCVLFGRLIQINKAVVPINASDRRKLHDC